MVKLELVQGAAAVSFDETDRVLLIKKNHGRRRRGLPGGALDPGESPEEAAQRETWEEAGVRVAIEHLIGSYTLDNGFAVCAFRCSILDGTPELPLSGEIAEVEWHPADDLPSPRSNILHYVVPDALQGRRDVTRTNLPRVS